jgi:hypothetical protein
MCRKNTEVEAREAEARRQAGLAGLAAMAVAAAALQRRLADHNPLSAEVQGTRVIAGVEALHLRENNGPQA